MGKTKISDLRAEIRNLQAERSSLIAELTDAQACAAIKDAENICLRQSNLDLREHVSDLKAALARALAGKPAASEGLATLRILGHGPGRGKIDAIKLARSMCVGLGLKDAKDLIESAPRQIGPVMTRKVADEWAEEFRAVGAAVEVRAAS